MKYKIIARSIKSYDKDLVQKYSSILNSEILNNNLVEFNGNSIIHFKYNDLVINIEISKPTDYKLRKIRQDKSKSAIYLLSVINSAILDFDFIIVDFNNWQYLKCKFLKGEYPFDITSYNTVMISAIIGSLLGLLVSLIVTWIKCPCK